MERGVRVQFSALLSGKRRTPTLTGCGGQFPVKLHAKAKEVMLQRFGHLNSFISATIRDN